MLDLKPYVGRWLVVPIRTMTNDTFPCTHGLHGLHRPSPPRQQHRSYYDDTLQHEAHKWVITTRFDIHRSNL